jgi:hypothetical protein
MNYNDLVKECVKLSIEKKATQIVNEYVEYFTPGKDASSYSLEQLDSIYYYLEYIHNKKIIDIFDLKKQFMSTLFLI